MIYLRQSTASQEVPLGYFLDSTDGDTEETGLTIANTDIKLWKTGATTLANKNSGGATHISGGIYYAVLDATDTGTLGPMVIFVHATGALTVRLECVVLTAITYDALIVGTTTELSGVPSATANPIEFIKWLFAKSRNLETTTASASTVSNDAGATIATSTISDNGTTFTKGEFA